MGSIEGRPENSRAQSHRAGGRWIGDRRVGTMLELAMTTLYVLPAAGVLASGLIVPAIGYLFARDAYESVGQRRSESAGRSGPQAETA